MVRLPGASARSDSDIARAALNALAWDVWVPDERVTVTVSDGWVKLDGTVDTQHQKLAAERVIRTLTGVKSVTNLITVTPIGATGRYRHQDRERLSAQRGARRAGRSKSRLTAARVVLRGNVRAWDERETAERAAWAAPGVAEVDNHIIVQPMLRAKTSSQHTCVPITRPSRPSTTASPTPLRMWPPANICRAS